MNNIDKAIIKIKHDIDVNNRCLKEETIQPIKRLLELSIQFDRELLELLEVKDEKR